MARNVRFYLAASIFGCAACVYAKAAELTPDDIRFDGLKVTFVSARQTVDVEPLTVYHHQYEGTIEKGKPGWRGPTYLPKVAWCFGALKPGSLVIVPVDQPDKKCLEGTDYLLDKNWGTLATVESSAHPPGSKFRFAFDYTLSRLDLVEQSADGKMTVKKGVEDNSQPTLPEVSPGSRALLGIYLAPNTVALTTANLNIIDPNYRGIPPVRGVEYLAGVKKKLTSGQSVTLAFLGDSITAQKAADFRDGQGSFIDRFAKYLETRHRDRKVIVTPKEKVVPPAEKQIVIVKAGIGGNTSSDGLARLDKDVLTHKPDAVIVMFGVNDENRKGNGNNVPVPQYKENLEKIADKVRGAGAELVIMTTSMKNLGWISTVGNLNEYAAAAREVAQSQKACLVDNYQAWVDIPKLGYHYMIYLGTCINHPVDPGHRLFCEGLKAAFADP